MLLLGSSAVLCCWGFSCDEWNSQRQKLSSVLLWTHVTYDTYSCIQISAPHTATDGVWLWKTDTDFSRWLKSDQLMQRLFSVIWFYLCDAVFLPRVIANNDCDWTKTFHTHRGGELFVDGSVLRRQRLKTTTTKLDIHCLCVTQTD